MFEFTLPAIFVSVVLLMVRVVIAIAFIRESRHKFLDIRGFAKSDEVPIPLVYVVATAELCVALGMLTGVLAQWAGLGLILLMLVTTRLHIFKWHTPYWATKGGWEYDILMIVLASVIVVFGAGDFALFS